MLVLDTKSEVLWRGVLLPPRERVARFVVVDHDKYSREIKLFTAEGYEILLDFEGNVLANSSHRVNLKILP